MLTLALAYALIEEGLLTQSLFNPNYAGQRLLDPGFVPSLGIGLPWTIYVLTLHVVWSIGAPIAVVEGLAGRRHAAAWLGRVGYPVTAVLYVLGCVGTAAISLHTDSSVAPWPRLLAVVVLVALALRRRPAAASSAERPVPSWWPALLAGLLASSVFQVLIWATDVITPWGAAAAMAAVLTVSALTVRVWSGRRGWSFRQVAAIGCGALLTYAWHAFVQTPLMVPSVLVDRLGDVVFGVLALALVLAVRVRAGRDRSEIDRSTEAGEPSSAASSRL